ncbi:hypothetical protein DFH27DRAFT_328509 [Peziza echinospora]|nr:hypothetical protein DFH27DRAFT_328509 [Peziza echinospora]
MGSVRSDECARSKPNRTCMHDDGGCLRYSAVQRPHQTGLPASRGTQSAKIKLEHQPFRHRCQSDRACAASVLYSSGTGRHERYMRHTIMPCHSFQTCRSGRPSLRCRGGVDPGVGTLRTGREVRLAAMSAVVFSISHAGRQYCDIELPAGIPDTYGISVFGFQARFPTAAAHGPCIRRNHNIIDGDSHSAARGGVWRRQRCGHHMS